MRDSECAVDMGKVLYGCASFAGDRDGRPRPCLGVTRVLWLAWHQRRAARGRYDVGVKHDQRTKKPMNAEDPHSLSWSTPNMEANVGKGKGVKGKPLRKEQHA